MLRATKSSTLSANGLRFGIVAARYNEELSDSLLTHCVATIEAAGGKVSVVRVPGSFEVTAAVARFAKSRRCDCVVALGVLLQGETSHAQHIGDAVANGLTTISILTGVPTIFGIVTANTLRQAQVRCRSKHYNRGREAAQTAIEMARIWKNKTQ